MGRYLHEGGVPLRGAPDDILTEMSGISLVSWHRLERNLAINVALIIADARGEQRKR